MPKRYILSFIYFGRALAIVGLHHRCRRAPAATLIFGAVTGLLWLSTVPPTSGLVALMFGTRWLTMLFGFAFFSHQVGGFLGVWLGGVLFEATGSYDVVWWLSVFFGVASAVINLPIVEKPVARPAAAAGMIAAMPAAIVAPTWRTPARHPDLRLPDRHDRLRAALGARLLPDADDGGQRLGPRRVRAGDRDRRCCCGARRSRSPARSPTASARSGC